ncbi:MAG: hydroxypyruvate isomerase [Firmicutes bacterium]|jgi:hydroxypyruvate isomerase|nr:hydroxypyruvate isomerase [Bacillota bacterium]
MIRYAANLSLLYPDRPFLERFAAARASGFSAVEFMFPYAAGLDAVEEALTDHQLQLILFNLPAGRWEDGERGIAILPDRRSEFREGVAEAIRYATRLQCSRINCLAGILPGDLSADEAWATLADNTAYAADRLAEHGIRLMVEAVNSLDIPGFFLNTPTRVEKLLDQIQRPNAYIQYDVYHTQRMQGELIGTFKRLASRIGHVQIADNPGRHEPGTGEIHYDHVLQAFEELGYEGFVGLEYIPAADTDAGLRWLPREKR